MKQWNFLEKQAHRIMLMKRLRRWYLRETVYSQVLPTWAKVEITKVLEYSKYPQKVTDVVNIVTTLERFFGYTRMDAIILAKEIHKQHNEEIGVYMKKWFKLGTRQQRIRILTKRGALKEQRARGFVNVEDTHLDTELPYLHSTIKDIVWPKQWPYKRLINMAGIYDKLPLIGVSGYTGISLPKRLLNR